MKTISLLSAVLLFPATSIFASTSSDLALLKSRLDLQEKRIVQLERTIKRLGGSLKSSVQKPHKTAVTQKSKNFKMTGSKEYIVVKGDTLTNIAHKNNSSVVAIRKVNGLKNDALRIGQKLMIPQCKTTAKYQPVFKKQKVAVHQVNKKVAHHSKAKGGEYIVKAGDTFYGIARANGMSEADLKAANPNAKPKALQIGQKLILGGAKPPVVKKSVKKSSSKKVAKKSTAKKSTAKKSTVKKSTSKIASKASSQKKAVEKSSSSKPATHKKSTSVAKKAPASAPSKSSSSRKARTITVDSQMTYGEFASKYGVSTSQLNSLNGLSLSKSTLLAKGSELYVPF